MYFSKFPNILYTLDDGKTVQLTKDIFIRAGFIKDVISNAAFYEELDIPEGDTPDILADKIYGNSLYHWVLLLANDIVDPVLEWPMTQNQLVGYAEEKYNGEPYATHHYEDADGFVVNAGAGTYPVSNIEYETRLNDEKRRIKVPRTEILTQIVAEFTKLIKQ